MSEQDIITNLNATKIVIEKCPDGHDDDERENRQNKKR